MSKVHVDEPKLNWMEAALQVSCETCQPIVLRVMKNKMIDNQVNTLIGIDKEFIPLKPSDLYNTMCSKCKKSFRTSIVKFIINSESSSLVREKLMNELNGHS
jgi:hypothetical protein